MPCVQCLTILVEQAVVLCQVEKAKEDMLNHLYTSIRLVLSNYFHVLCISLSICYFQGKTTYYFFSLCDVSVRFEHPTLLISSFLRFKVDLVVYIAMFFMKMKTLLVKILIQVLLFQPVECQLLRFCSLYLYFV